MPTTTYGKRSVKRKNIVEDDDSSLTMTVASTSTAAVEQRSDNEEDEILLQPTKNAVQKKRKIEAMKPLREATKSQKAPSPIHDSTGNEDAELPRPKVTRTYGTPKKAAPTKASRPTLPQPELSLSLPAASPSKQGDSTNLPVTPSKHGSPTKLAKRMLARSKTESSVTDIQKSPSSPFDQRTPSLPILPSATQSSSLPSPTPSRTLSRTNTVLDASSALQPTGVSSSSSLLPLPAPPSLAGTSKTLSRTYAGRSRSYLASAPPELNADGTIDDPDEARESYSSLRMRWGVDESEDDPYYHIDNSQTATGDESSQSPSPRKGTRSRGSGNKSATSTPLASPTKNRDKGSKTNGSQQPRPPPLPSNMMNPLKSITELRNKGESRRFLDEVAYLLDGMAKSQGAGLIRASALEMVTKLCDGEFFRKAKAADVFAKVYDLFINAGVGRGDKVLDTLFIFFIVLISKDLPSLAELATHVTDSRQSSPATSNAKGKERAHPENAQSLVEILFSILPATCSSTSDPLVLVASPKGNAYTDAELRVAGLGKKEKSTMTHILSIIRNKSSVFPTGTKIGHPLLITHVLQSIPPSLIPQHHLPALLVSLRESLKPLHVWNEGTIPSLELDLDVEFENVFAHLRLLDLYLLGQWEPSPESSQSQSQDSSPNDEVLLEARQAWLIDGLVMLGIYAEIALLRDRKVTEFEGALKCLESTLRVLAVENVKDLIRETYLDPTCKLRKAKCLDACSCSRPNGASALELLVQLYVRQQTDLVVKKEEDDDDDERLQMDADASFLRGHLAVLFGLLMQRNKKNQGALQELLPGGQSKSEIKIKLNRLVDQARQFVAFFTVVLGQETGESETRRVEDRERESSSRIAKEIVEFLGQLRDGA
ncbi:hypothetical protein MD484_g4464, partial [Candolleomyces efflorescens]